MHNGEIELEGKITCVFGLPYSGKTNFMKWLLSQRAYRRHMIFDTVQDYPTSQYNAYRPDVRHWERGVNEELNEFVDATVEQAPKALRPRYVVVDEANRSLPNNKDPGMAVADLVDFNTHYDPQIGVILICRRPAQLNSDFENLASHYFVFAARGKNDYSAYGDISRELPDLLDERERYEFAHVDEEGDCTLFEPVELMEGRGRI